MEVLVKASKIVLAQGDITREETDAIVNAANSELKGGGGVDGAVHRVGGAAIMDECRRIGSCPAGQAVITTGGNLKAPWVIHTVGPIYRDGAQGEADLLASAYRESLALASKKRLKRLSFPAISTGVYGYPLEEAASIALRTVKAYLEVHSDIEEVRFVLFDEPTLSVFSEELKKMS